MTAEQIRHARDLLTRPDNTVSSIARAGAGDGVGDGEAGELGDPQVGLDADRQQRVIAAAGPDRGLRCCQQRADLLRVRKQTVG